MVKNNNLRRKKKTIKNEFSQKTFVTNTRRSSRRASDTRIKKRNSIIQRVRNRFGQKK